MRKRGFTILELMVALVLFSVGMLSVVQVFPANRKLLTQTANMTQATLLAQEQLEIVLTEPYADLTTGTYAARAAVSSDTSSPFSLYDRRIDVAYINPANRQVGTSDQGMKRVTVTIYWTERSVERTFTLSTYVTR